MTEKNFPGVYICDKYPDGIPEYVEEGEKDCQKFQAEKKRPENKPLYIVLPLSFYDICKFQESASGC